MFLHGAVGVVVVLVALLALVEALSHGPLQGRSNFAGPFVMSGGGGMVLVYVTAHYLTDHARGQDGTVDAAHWLIGGALVISGLVVAAGRAHGRRSAPFEVGGPFGLILVAALFVVHSEREGVELILHASIAIALVMAALAQVSVILAGEEGRALRIFAALLLVIGGLQLILYDAQSLPAAPSGHRDLEH